MLDGISESVLKELITAKIKVYLDSGDGKDFLEKSVEKEMKDRLNGSWPFWNKIRDGVNEILENKMNELLGGKFETPEKVIIAGLIDVLHKKGFSVKV